MFDSSGNFVASQLTDGGGNFDIEGLAPGTYTVDEVLQSGWTQTAPPPPGIFTVTVTAGSNGLRSRSSATSRTSPSAVRSSTT